MMDYTRYEKARIIGARSLQIAMGAPLLLKSGKEDLEKVNYSPIELSKREFESGVLPITIRRPLPKRLEH